MLSQVLLFIPFLFTAHQYGIHSACPSIYLSILSAVVPRYSSLHLEGFIFPEFCLLLIIFWLFLIFSSTNAFSPSVPSFNLVVQVEIYVLVLHLLFHFLFSIYSLLPSDLESLVTVLFLWCYQPATWCRMTNCPSLPCTKILGPMLTRMADHGT